MNKFILIAMIIGCALVSGQGLDKLEQAYLSKAETLQNDHDVRAKANDTKLATDSKRLAESYLSALRSMLKRETQNGDFDAAVAVKAKITEIELILLGEIVVSKPIPKITEIPNMHHDLIGIWKTTNASGARYIYTFYNNGTTFHANNLNSDTITGKWTILNDTIFIRFDNEHSIELKRVGNIYKSKIFTFKKEASDYIVGQWQRIRVSAIYTFNVDGTISNTNGQIGHWKREADIVSLNWGKSWILHRVKDNKYLFIGTRKILKRIYPVKLTDIQIEKLLTGRTYAWGDKQFTLSPKKVFKPSWSSHYKVWFVKDGILVICRSGGTHRRYLTFKDDYSSYTEPQQFKDNPQKLITENK